MAEQFAFNQFFRDGRAVDFDERPFSFAAVMDVTGNDFFPRAGISGDQHRRRGGCHPFCHLETTEEGWILTDDGI